VAVLRALFEILSFSPSAKNALSMRLPCMEERTGWHFERLGLDTFSGLSPYVFRCLPPKRQERVSLTSDHRISPLGELALVETRPLAQIAAAWDARAAGSRRRQVLIP
jgi:hypothetical protein